MQGVYKIADTAISVDSVYDQVHVMCADYRTEENPSVFVTTRQADIDFEREKSRQEDLLEGLPVRDFPDAYLETLAVYRKLVTALLPQGVLLFHGSVVAVDGMGYLFTAKSGTGKSTHTSLWRQKFGSRAIMINDDKPLLRIGSDGVRVYGTPWDGKHRLSTNTSVPLKAICILQRDVQNHIEPVSFHEAMPMLFQQSYRPDSEAEMLHTMSLIARLGKLVGLYRLGCNMDPEAADVAWKGMQG